LGRTPDWANGGQGPLVLPTDVNDYARIARWAAERYAGKVQSFEVYNEPNNTNHVITTPVEYTRLLCAAYPAFRLSPSQPTVIYGGTSGNDWQWIDASYQAGAKGCFDVMATHPYQAQSLPPEYLAPDNKKWWTNNITLVRQVMADHGDLDTPVWFTEFGWSTYDGGVTEEQQATYLVDMLRMTADRYPYVKKVSWYTSRDEATGKVKADHYGLFTLALEPKQSALRLQELLTTGASGTAATERQWLGGLTSPTEDASLV